MAVMTAVFRNFLIQQFPFFKTAVSGTVIPKSALVLLKYCTIHPPCPSGLSVIARPRAVFANSSNFLQEYFCEIR